MVNMNREKRRILLVEDHVESREIAAFNLEEYMLIFACDFDEGLHLARRGYFDLYILDNWLPDGAGVDLCRAIRGFDPHTPILFYSACSCGHDLDAAFSAGAQGYFVKPVIFEELKLAVAQLISAAHETAIEARRAMIAALREEIAGWRMKTAAQVEQAKENRVRAEEKALRNKAQIAFLAAGGARGEFARAWLSVFRDEVRGSRTDAMRSH